MPFSNSTFTFGVTNTVPTITPDQRANAIRGAELTELLQSLYSLVLFDTVANSTLVAAGLDPAGRTEYAEYFFRVPPKVIDFDEPFATTIASTQDGGKHVESYGSIIKAIRLNGTTGLRPNKIPLTVPEGAVSTPEGFTSVLNAIESTNPTTVVSTEKTGYDDIMFLRNIFRKYSDIKATDTLSSRVVMLWRNIKDADYWIVEPEDFRVSQNASSPLTYEYNIALKTLSRFDFSFTLTDDPLERMRNERRAASRLQEYNDYLLNSFQTINAEVDSVPGFSDFSKQLVLSPVLKVVKGLNAIKTSAFGIVRGFRPVLNLMVDNVTLAIDKLIAGAASIAELLISDFPRAKAIRSLRRILVVASNIAQEPYAAAISSTAETNSAVSRYAAAYDRPGSTTTARRAPMSSTYIGSDTMSSDVSSSTVYPGEDIRDIAERLLGDRTRWRLLTLLNVLRAPFVSPVPAPGVLSPGDTILYPSPVPSTGVVGTQRPSNSETANQAAEQNSPILQSYGRDLRLKSLSLGDTEVTDLAINQRGDISSIQGIPNVEQAMRLKFLTSKGELPANPYYGAKFNIGSKATSASFNELRINTINTLVSDSRVDSIASLQFVALGDTLAVLPKVVLKNSRDTLEVNFALRRF